MGKKYPIDSNAVIGYLRGNLPASGMTFMNEVVNKTPLVSVITKIEVLGFNTTPEAYKILTDFFEDALVLPLSDEVVQKTIELRKNYKIKLPDAIIAATALAYNLTLITRNSADFQKVTGLVGVDSHQQ
ncbi:MAG TPA: type II toxin-antitoxin system VapC family toxin [Saprospiraceae bacterium]|nr:type II toxin-antitoxin system VapC family toxin [Saprospiraceae bacterium]HMQ85286.1 type II toxin-antitoxin system VapC family toxin [Saprospiraceae bacterium]